MLGLTAWIILRGILTLPLRVEQSNTNAMTLVRWLEGASGDRSSGYFGLESHSGHEITRGR